MLADPTDITAGAQARRDRVRARIQAYNAAMTAACARHTPHRRGDGNAVLTTTDSTSKTSVRAITGTRANAVRQHWHKLRGKQASGHDCGNRHGARGRTSIGSDARLGPSRTQAVLAVDGCRRLVRRRRGRGGVPQDASPARQALVRSPATSAKPVPRRSMPAAVAGQRPGSSSCRRRPGQPISRGYAGGV